MPTGNCSRSRSTSRLLGTLAVVGLIVAITHWPMLSTRAFTFDDRQYLIDNHLVRHPSWASAAQLFAEVLTPSTVHGYYQPLTMVSLMLDWARGGRTDNLRIFHQTSLALHVINTLLVIVLLHQLLGQVWAAAWAGLLFGVHPMTVEPVAWLSERKTLLAAFFTLASIILFVRWARAGLQSNSSPRGGDGRDRGAGAATSTHHQRLPKSLYQDPGGRASGPSADRPEVGPPGSMVRRSKREGGSPRHAARGWGWYVGALVVFALALLAKPTSTPLPALLLLLDFWPLRRLSWRAVLEKVPFFVVAGVSAVVTVVSQGRTAALALPHQYAPGWIPLTICHNVVFYLYKIVWPAQLSAHYAFPQPFDLSSPMVLAGVIGTPVLLAALLASLRWTRAAATGWLFFFIAIFPTLGVIGFTHSIAANKYAYLPAVGLLMILVCFLTWLGRRVAPPGRIPVRVASVGLLLGLAGLSIVGTRAHLAHWRDTEALYRHMLELSPGVAGLHNDLADELTQQGRLDEAAQEYEIALRLNPNMYDGHNGLGIVLLAQNRPGEAIPHFEIAIRLDPRRGAAYGGLGAALARLGRDEEAYRYFEQSLQRDPHIAEVHANMGAILATRGDLGRAIEHYHQALRLKPESARTHFNLGVALVRMGRLEPAVEQFRQATRLEPTYIPAHGGLGQALLMLGRVDEAVAVYEAAVRIAPDDPRLRAALAEAQSRRSSSAPSSP